MSAVMSEPSRAPGSARSSHTPIRKVITGLSLFGAVLLVGAIGYTAAGWPVGDAVYMVIITIFGVGYGEVHPVGSGGLRALTIVVIVAGYGAVLYTVGGLLQMLVDGELNAHLGVRRMHREIDRLEGHAIICGYGRMGSSLARDLATAGTPFVAIDADPGTLERGGPSHLTIVGDATEEAVLERAGIGRASVLATVLSDDATNVFVTLTARSMNPTLTIIARGEQPRTEEKLRRCGADQVVLPTTIGAAKMSQLITRPTADAILAGLTGDGDADIDLAHLGLGFTEVRVEPGSAVVGVALERVALRGAHEHLVVGVKRADGVTELHPSDSVVLAAGDVLVAVGLADDRPTLSARRDPGAGVTYRGVRSG